MTPRLGERPIEIVGYDDRYAVAFRRLNLEWLEGYGLLEPADLHYLDRPREAILAAGGRILFAVGDGVALGTCAVLPRGPGVVELLKLAVAAAAQRRGIGRRLAVAALDHARAAGAGKVVLVSNSRLTSAIRLYESLGFGHAPLPGDTGYATADVYMELRLARSDEVPGHAPACE